MASDREYSIAIRLDEAKAASGEAEALRKKIAAVGKAAESTEADFLQWAALLKKGDMSVAAKMAAHLRQELDKAGDVSVENRNRTHRLAAELQKLAEKGQFAGTSLGKAFAQADAAARASEKTMVRTAGRTGGAMGNLAKDMGNVGRTSTNTGMAVLEASRALEDLQYGVRGVLNNIPTLVVAMGGTMGLAGVISVVAVALTQVGRLFGSTKKEAEDSLRAIDFALKKTKGATDEWTAAQERAATQAETLTTATDAQKQAVEGEIKALEESVRLTDAKAASELALAKQRVDLQVAGGELSAEEGAARKTRMEAQAATAAQGRKEGAEEKRIAILQAAAGDLKKQEGAMGRRLAALDSIQAPESGQRAVAERYRQRGLQLTSEIGKLGAVKTTKGEFMPQVAERVMGKERALELAQQAHPTAAGYMNERNLLTYAYTYGKKGTEKYLTGLQERNKERYDTAAKAAEEEEKARKDALEARREAERDRLAGVTSQREALESQIATEKESIAWRRPVEQAVLKNDAARARAADAATAAEKERAEREKWQEGAEPIGEKLGDLRNTIDTTRNPTWQQFPNRAKLEAERRAAQEEREKSARLEEIRTGLESGADAEAVQAAQEGLAGIFSPEAQTLGRLEGQFQAGTPQAEIIGRLQARMDDGATERELAEVRRVLQEVFGLVAEKNAALDDRSRKQEEIVTGIQADLERFKSQFKNQRGAGRN